MFSYIRFFVLMMIVFTSFTVQAAERTLTYDIVRKDEVIGEHRVTISKQDRETRVDTETHIEIESFFITEYAFDFSSEEVWRDGQLIALSSTTTEDGELRTVTVALDGDRYTINSIRDNLDRLQRIPSSVFPATPWTPMVAKHDRLFDPSSGVILEVSVTSTDSNSYDISGEWTRTLTYDEADNLVEMRFPDRTNTSVFYKLK